MSYHMDHEEFYEAFSDGEVDRLWDAYQYAVKGGESQPRIYASQEKLREPLAKYAHEAWSGWVQYMFSKFEPPVPTTYSGRGRWVHLRLPTALYERWRRQMNTPYADLPESEKAPGRQEADNILETIRLQENAEIAKTFEKLTELEETRDRVSNFLKASDEEMKEAKALSDYQKAVHGDDE